MKKLLIASALSTLLAAPAIAGPAEAAPSHKNMCSGIVSDGSGNLDKGALTLYWSLSNLHVNASDQTHNFRVKGIHGQIGVSDMTIRRLNASMAGRRRSIGSWCWAEPRSR